MSRKLILFIVSLTLFSLFIRLYRFTEPSGYYFDEVYHAVTAKGYADNNPNAYDPFAKAPKEGTAYDWLHPPLAKLIQAGSIKIFGDVPLGWRLPSVIFGTAIIPATFILANILFGPTTAIFASTVVAFENLTFVMSRITMNDVFVTFFILVSFIFAALYVKSSTSEESEPAPWEVIGEVRGVRARTLGGVKKATFYIFLTAIFLGFAVSSKWTGAYAIAVIFLYVSFSHLRSVLMSTTGFHLGGGGVLLRLTLLIIIPFFIYLAAYGQFWLQGHSAGQFIDLHKQIWWYQNRHDLKHSYGTTPLYCVPEGLEGSKTWCPWILNSRGVYFSYEEYGDRAGYIYALGNPLIFWGGVLAVSYLVGKYIEERKKEYALVLLGYFIFWVPWIFSPRIMFFYHYLPSVPFMAIILGVTHKNIYLSKLKYLAVLIILLFIATFFYFYPISSGYPINPESIDNYMWLPTWR